GKRRRLQTRANSGGRFQKDLVRIEFIERKNVMYIAMNRFKVKNGSEEEFENVWKGRDSRLSEMQGFREFLLLRGPVNEAEGYTLFASHTIWESHEDFVAWTKSQNFRDAHRNA